MSAAEIIAELPRLSSDDLARVEAKVRELTEPAREVSKTSLAANHPALGMWKDRIDLPSDSVDASNLLRERMMLRNDTETGTTHQ